MNINFHYAAVKVLAHHAGFSKRESQLIAYASQYTDDAAEHEPMALDKDPDVPGIRFEHGEFDPICTAHKQLDYVRGMLKQQARLYVYVCFHFIPSLQGTRRNGRFRKVKKDGRLARRLVGTALEAWKTAESEDESTRALMSLGIALHSYADTWAHQGFSGYWDRRDNDIRSLKTRGPDARWRRVNLLREFLSYAAPDIGHAEAGMLPDRSEVHWKCQPSKRSRQEQCNCEAFLGAAEKILGLLSGATGKGEEWRTVETRLRRCFLNPLPDNKRFGRRERHEWRRQFPGLGFHYDERAWFSNALRPKGGFLDLVGARLDLDPQDFEVGCGREYFHFHAAAKQQRDTVLKEIRAAAARQQPAKQTGAVAQAT